MSHVPLKPMRAVFSRDQSVRHAAGANAYCGKETLELAVFRRN